MEERKGFKFTGKGRSQTKGEHLKSNHFNNSF